jgi:hypothetical protein
MKYLYMHLNSTLYTRVSIPSIICKKVVMIIDNYTSKLDNLHILGHIWTINHRFSYRLFPIILGRLF